MVAEWHWNEWFLPKIWGTQHSAWKKNKNEKNMKTNLSVFTGA